MNKTLNINSVNLLMFIYKHPGIAEVHKEEVGMNREDFSVAFEDIKCMIDFDKYSEIGVVDCRELSIIAPRLNGCGFRYVENCNKGVVIFGAGDFGRKTLDIISSDEVAFFVDNDKRKAGTEINGVKVYHFSDVSDILKHYRIIVSVGAKYINEVFKQLKMVSVVPIDTYLHMLQVITKNKIDSRPDYIGGYNKAISWIHTNTIHEAVGASIINTTSLRLGYPEVTGYYIPTLLRWGYRELAVEYAKWLVSIQHSNGAWYDTLGRDAYIFDSGQILKGLLAVRHICPFVDPAIKKGVEWILSNVQANGRLMAINGKVWDKCDDYCEIIHLYCLSPIMQAAEIFEKNAWKEKVTAVLNYYKKRYYNEIMDFSLLSHFYAYVMEALLDLGEIDMAKAAMTKIAELQDEDGFVPAYKNVGWVCSTGLFQLALVWFRLGDKIHGDKAFSAAFKLQNESGGWYGSYPLNNDNSNNYFPDAEISWAVKYFLDALYYKNRVDFDISAPVFKDIIDKSDGRYQVILENARSVCKLGGDVNILDVGCGKGRYLRNLSEDLCNANFYGVDISKKVIEEKLDKNISWSEGTLTCIPFEDNKFSIVYTCEALEHAIDTKSAIREMARVVRPGGRIVVIDKNKSALGTLEICEWEQWFDEDELANIMQDVCSDVSVISDVHYEDHFKENLFSAWIGVVK